MDPLDLLLIGLIVALLGALAFLGQRLVQAQIDLRSLSAEIATPMPAVTIPAPAPAPDMIPVSVLERVLEQVASTTDKIARSLLVPEIPAGQQRLTELNPVGQLRSLDDDELDALDLTDYTLPNPFLRDQNYATAPRRDESVDPDFGVVTPYPPVVS
jgi:HAMP domain-containing protein